MSEELGLTILKYLRSHARATRAEIASHLWGETGSPTHPYLAAVLGELEAERVVQVEEGGGAGRPKLYTLTGVHPLSLLIFGVYRTAQCPECRRRVRLIHRFAGQNYERWELSCQCGEVVPDITELASLNGKSETP